MYQFTRSFGANAGLATALRTAPLHKLSFGRGMRSSGGGAKRPADLSTQPVGGFKPVADTRTQPVGAFKRVG